MQNYYSNSNRTNEDAIIEKIQNTVAAFRRERDELHRKKQLSTERLRLIREEKNSLEKTVNALKDRLFKLEAQTSGKAEKELEELEKKIQHLTREVQFQHNELVSKCDKIESLKKTIEEEARANEYAIQSQNDKIRTVRDLSATAASSTKTAMAGGMQNMLLQREMEEVNSERLWSEWPTIIEQKAASITVEAVDLHRSSEALERILEGYKRKFEVTVENAAMHPSVNAVAMEY